MNLCTKMTLLLGHNCLYQIMHILASFFSVDGKINSGISNLNQYEELCLDSVDNSA